MRSKGFLVLLGVLIGLILITLVYREWKKPARGLMLLSNFGELQRIRLGAEDSTIILELAGGEWRIMSPIEAKPDRKVVDQLMEGLKKMELGEVVSSRPEMYATFGVDEETGRRVSLHSLSDSISFIAGRTAGMDETYVRLSGGSDVYLTAGVPRHLLDRELDNWRDKSILSLVKTDVERITFEYPSQSYSLLRDEGGWALDGDSVDSDAVALLLSMLENLRADGFVDDGELQPEFTIEVTLVGGKGERLYIGTSTDGGYPVMRDGDNTIFLLSERKVDRLKKKASDFR